MNLFFDENPILRGVVIFLGGSFAAMTIILLSYIMVVRDMNPARVIGPPLKQPPMRYTPVVEDPALPDLEETPRNIMDEEAARQRERIKKVEVP